MGKISLIRVACIAGLAVIPSAAQKTVPIKALGVRSLAGGPGRESEQQLDRSE